MRSWVPYFVMLGGALLQYHQHTSIDDQVGPLAERRLPAADTHSRHCYNSSHRMGQVSPRIATSHPQTKTISSQIETTSSPTKDQLIPGPGLAYARGSSLHKFLDPSDKFLDSFFKRHDQIITSYHANIYRHYPFN